MICSIVSGGEEVYLTDETENFHVPVASVKFVSVPNVLDRNLLKTRIQLDYLACM